MSCTGPRCPKHPSQLIAGVCPYCLRDKLSALPHIEHHGEVGREGTEMDVDACACYAGLVTRQPHSLPCCHHMVDHSVCTMNVDDSSFPTRMESNQDANSICSLHRNVASGDIIKPLEASTSTRIRKKTLSSLFIQEDADVITSGDGCKGDACLNTSRSSTQYHKHASFSGRMGTSCTPFRDTESSKMPAWVSVIFRRKRKSKPRILQQTPMPIDHDCGWRHDGGNACEPPRPSSWEQFRHSSFEGLRSTWEPPRVSWEGVMRSSDGESVYSGIGSVNDSLAELRKDTETECQGLQDMGGELGVKLSKATRKHFAKRALKGKARSADFSNQQNSISLQSTQFLRDASTQTSLGVSSDVAEINALEIPRSLDDNDGSVQAHPPRQPVKASNAIWSKLWSKAFSNSKWALRRKLQEEHGEKQNTGTSLDGETCNAGCDLRQKMDDELQGVQLH